LARSGLQDLRYGLRVLARAPGLAIPAVLTLAVGIGVNAAMFSVVHRVLLAPLPYAAPDRVVGIWQASPALGFPKLELAEAQLLRLRDQARSLRQVGGYVLRSVTWIADDEAVRLPSAWVSASVFEALGARPLLGRTFRASDNAPGLEPVVILSEDLWRSRLGANPRVLGMTVVVDRRLYTVIGVMPAGFRMPEDLAGGRPAQVWIPQPIDEANPNWDDYSLRTVARLAPGRTAGEAGAEVSALLARMRKENPAAAIHDPRYGVRVLALAEDLTGDLRGGLGALWAAVGLVLLIACGNVAGLVLARALERRQEMALRIALGAGAWRLARQLLAEGLLLVIAGMAAGLALAAWALRLLVHLGPDNVPRLGEVTLSLPAVAFTAALGALCTVLVSLVPALWLARQQIERPLREGAHGSRGIQRAQSLLVAAEVALGVVLITAAGMTLESFRATTRLDPGFDPTHLLAVELELPPVRRGDALGTTVFYTQLLARLRALPGVVTAGAASSAPCAGLPAETDYLAAGSPGGQAASPSGHLFFWLATPRYFETLRLPVVRGRAIDERDRPGAPLVAVVNATLAHGLARGGEPLGKKIQVSLGEGRRSPWLEVVGVVGNLPVRNASEARQPEAFLAQAQGLLTVGDPARTMTVMLRSAGEPLALAGAARRAVRAAGPRVAVSNVQTVEHLMESTVAPLRFSLQLMAAFGALALALAAVGVYALLANVVRWRAHEMGVRCALGARRGDLLRLLAGRGLATTLAGVGAGLAVVGALAPVGRRFLFGVAWLEPLVLAAVVVLFGLTALAASVVPALRALRLDPQAVLRGE
jgi:putative ABC transport system permease protein